MEKFDPQKQAGFATDKKVWCKNTWGGALAAKRIGATSGVIVRANFVTVIGDTIRLRTADGAEHDVAAENLRLTPPPSASNKPERAKASRPKKRKEAIDPAYGEELTIDVLGEG